MTFAFRPFILFLCVQLAGCASTVARLQEDDASASESASNAAPVQWTAGEVAPWQHKAFPGKRATRYRLMQYEGRDAMLVQASSSASMLRQTVHVAPQDLGLLRFSWKVPALIASADLATRELDDSPVRIVLAFEGDRSRFSMKDSMLSELSHAITGEPMPYATLMYVWSNQREEGTVIANPRTDRIRKIVLESGPKSLGRWLSYERDIRADFEKAFGEAPGALLGIGIMTDSDNTQSVTQAWYGPVQLMAKKP
jgi:hypothetical protein